MAKLRLLLLAVALPAGLLLFSSSASQAQVTSPLPNKPVRTIIPYVASGGSAEGGYVTNILITNLSTGSNGVVINHISTSGQLTSAGQEQVLAPRASLTLNIGGENRFTNLVVEWIAVGSDAEILATFMFEYRLASMRANETFNAVGILPQVPGTSFAAPFAYVREGLADAAPLLQGIAAVNTSNAPNTITVRVFDDTGALISSDTSPTLQPFELAFATVSDLPNLNTYLTGRDYLFGFLTITGTQPFAPVVVGNTGGRLFSLAVLAR